MLTCTDHPTRTKVEATSNSRRGDLGRRKIVRKNHSLRLHNSNCLHLNGASESLSLSRPRSFLSEFPDRGYLPCYIGLCLPPLSPLNPPSGSPHQSPSGTRHASISLDTLTSMATETPIRAERRSSPAVKSSALKSILVVKTSSERRLPNDDEEEQHATQSPSKRRKTSPIKPPKKKVVFDMDVNAIQEMKPQASGETRQKMDEVKTIVIRALKEHAMGDQEGYDTLKGIFHNDRRRKISPTSSQDEDNIEPGDLIYYVKALKTCAPQIGRSCLGLVHEVLNIPWLGRPDDFVDAYIDFLANLVTGQSIFLSNVLTMLVEKFRDFRPSQWSAGDFPEVSCDAMRRRLHRALHSVLQLFPAARRVLLSLLAKHFPFSDESKAVHMAFVQNLLRLREYAPDMGAEVMELITDRLVKVSFYRLQCMLALY